MGKIGSWRRFTSNWIKKKGTCGYPRIRKALKKAKKTSKGLSCSKIISLTNCYPRFIGCFTEKTLSTLKIVTKPVFLMTHIGHETGHWIAIGLFVDAIEIFDPLGFEIFNWPAVPCHLLRFIYNYSTNKKLLISGKVQPNTSHLCAFYCLVYITKRTHLSFSQIQSLFRKPHQNDKLLLSLF